MCRDLKYILTDAGGYEVFRSMSAAERYKAAGEGIICVTASQLAPVPPPQQIETVCRAGIRKFIVREKNMDSDSYTGLLREILNVCAEYGAVCAAHSFPEAALKTGCTSLHMPLPLFRRYHDLIRSSCESGMILSAGTSVHSEAEAAEAVSLGASYITAGHIYSTGCKPGLPPRGLSFLKRICMQSPVPVYAIGGIHPSLNQLPELAECGVHGVCLMSGLMKLSL